jgi:hypothetical protein
VRAGFLDVEVDEHWVWEIGYPAGDGDGGRGRLIFNSGGLGQRYDTDIEAAAAARVHADDTVRLNPGYIQTMAYRLVRVTTVRSFQDVTLYTPPGQVRS